jgi:hypothetical protein
MNYKYIGTHRSKDIQRSTLVIASFIVKILKPKKEVLLIDIFELLKRKLHITQKDFMITLNFLFIIGVIEYEKTTDKLRYLK